MGFACGVVALQACGSSNRHQAGDVEVPRHVAVVSMLAAADFAGSSVRITGARNPPADGKYRCSNTVGECLNFASDGTTSILVGLCPSEDAPAGTWDFSYEVFTGSDCEGDVLPNYSCLATLGEALPAGVITTNYVLCASVPARTTWDFDSVGVDPSCPVGATCIAVSSLTSVSRSPSASYAGSEPSLGAGSPSVRTVGSTPPIGR